MRPFAYACAGHTPDCCYSCSRCHSCCLSCCARTLPPVYPTDTSLLYHCLSLHPQALQTRQRSAASTPRGTPVAGASHIQQIHLTGNRSPLTAQSPRHSIHSGRSPHGSPLQGPSPRASPRPGQSPRAGATASVAVVTPGVAGSIPCSTTASVSGKSVVEAPVGPPVNTGTSVGGSGWMWGNVRKPGSVYTTAPNPDPGASWDD